MILMGVPPPAVELKMKSEGVSQEGIEKLMSVADPGRAKGRTPVKSKPQAKTLPTLKLHWNTLAGEPFGL